MLHANGLVLGALLPVDFKFGEPQLDPSQIKTQHDRGLELVKLIKEVTVSLTYIDST